MQNYSTPYIISNVSGGDFRLSQLLQRNAMKCLFLSSGQPRAHHCHSNARNASPGQQDPWRTNSWWRRALFRALMADKVHRTTQYTCLQPRQRCHSLKLSPENGFTPCRTLVFNSLLHNESFMQGSKEYQK